MQIDRADRCVRRIAQLLLGLTFIIWLFSSSVSAAERTGYDLDFQVDFSHNHFHGREVLHYLNQSNKPVEALFFHLYPNYQSQGEAAQPPHLMVSRITCGGKTLNFEVDQELVQVFLPEAVKPSEMLDLSLEFQGEVPVIASSETDIVAHLARELSSAAFRLPAMRSGSETLLRSGDTMVLGYAYPILAVQQGRKWQTETPDTVDDLEFAAIADYRIRVATERELLIAASGMKLDRYQPESPVESEDGQNQVVVGSGAKLRDIALVIGRNLKTSTSMVDGVEVRSIYQSNDAVVGERLLKVANRALGIYNRRFGRYPYPVLDLVEAPLLPGRSEHEFSGLLAIASAYYIDFQSPAALNLPGLIREQAAAFEDGLEFTTAHAIAHQWWGELVESDPYRHSFISEALAGVASVLYLEEGYSTGYAAQQMDAQVKAAYRVYRTFGGIDMAADRLPGSFVNEFQFQAIVQTKGTLFLLAVRDLIGPERMYQDLSRYYAKHIYRITDSSDLLKELTADTSKSERDEIHRLYRRWLHSRHGDEDIGPPPYQISLAMGRNKSDSRMRILNQAGRFFLRAGKTAVKPF